MSNYTNLGEDQPYEWNIVSLSVYVYGVEYPGDRPMFGSQRLKAVLEDTNRNGTQGCFERNRPSSYRSGVNSFFRAHRNVAALEVSSKRIPQRVHPKMTV